MILDRLGRLRFLDFKLGETIPDRNTIWLSREKPAKAVAFENLFQEYDDQLRAKGCEARSGQIEDATVVSASCQRMTDGGEGQGEEGQERLADLGQAGEGFLGRQGTRPLLFVNEAAQFARAKGRRLAPKCVRNWIEREYVRTVDETVENYEKLSKFEPERKGKCGRPLPYRRGSGSNNGNRENG